MRKLLLTLVLFISVQAHAAVKGNGTSGLIIFGNGSSGCAFCLPSPTSYTITFWYNAPLAPHNTADSEQVFTLDNETGVTADAKFIWSYPSDPTVYDICTQATVYPLVNITPVSGLTWYSIACVWDGSTLKSYRNGTQITSLTCGSIQAGVFLVQVLGYFAGNSHYAPGTIAEFAYNQNKVLPPNIIKGISSGFTPSRLWKPTVYATFWGTALSVGAEADLSGALASAGTSSTGTCYTSAVFSSTCSGVSRANHAPVLPFSGEEEGMQ